MPHTIIVIMNWRSTSGPCSEIEAGNHHFLETNITTEASVMIQMASPRTRPIEYLLLPECQLLVVRSELGALYFVLCTLYFGLVTNLAHEPVPRTAKSTSKYKVPSTK